jgi:phage gp36-like protein
MAYCTLDDIKGDMPLERIVQLTNDDNPRDGDVVPDILERCIADAEAVVDGYIPSRIKPLNPVPRLVKKCCIDLTVYNLWERHQINEDVEKRRKNAIKILEQIASGLIKLGLEAPGVKTNHSSFSHTANDQMFSMENMRSF